MVANSSSSTGGETAPKESGPSQAAIPLESEKDPGIPRFMWVIYAVLLGFALIYFPLNVFPRSAAPAGTEPSASVAQPGGVVNAAAGEILFKKNPCSACHLVTGTEVSVCPNLSNIANDAAGIVADAGYAGQATTADEYIHESIINPSAYIVPGFADGIMPQTFSESLSEPEINSLVMYLMTLKR